MKKVKKVFYFLLLIFLISICLPAGNSYGAEEKKEKIAVFFSPANQTVIEGSTFVVSVFVNTRQRSINAMDLTILFPPDKVTIVKPSTGTSLIQLWAEPPSYSNTKGVARLSGVIPNGVTTQSGLITAITFQAIATGDVTINILPTSKILANDGLGTELPVEFGRGRYTISPKPPEGTRIYSSTHPFESQWYNNKNVIINWEKDPDITSFSFIMDNEPLTIPDNIPETDASGTQMYYEDLNDGLHYFHIKASKGDVWGTPSHFLVRIDTIPPAGFRPKIDLLSAGNQTRGLVNFLTTDSLSGIDHYEVAVINKAESADISPVFVRSENPYQLSNPPSDKLLIIVRAIDGAGNIRDESIDVKLPFVVASFLDKYLLFIIIGVLSFILLFVFIHYFFGHHVARRVRQVVHLMNHEEELQKIEKVIHPENQPVQPPAPQQPVVPPPPVRPLPPTNGNPPNRELPPDEFT